MQPSLILAFFAAATNCSLTLSCLSTRTPRSLSIELFPSQVDPQPVLLSWIMFFHVQDLTFVLIELHKVLVSLIFQPVQVLLQGVSPFQSVLCPTQFGITDKVYPGTLDPIIQTTDEDTKQHWAQYHSLGDSTCDSCQCEREQFTTTLQVWLVSRFPTHLMDHTSTPSHTHFCRRRLWETISKALEISR